MTKHRFLFAALTLTAALLTGCEPPAKAPAETSAPPTTAGATGVGFVFNEGFMKEEATPNATLRWVHQNAAARVHVPEAGRYAITVRLVTASSPAKNTIEVSVNGQKAGTTSTDSFDLTNPVSAKMEANLKAGDNEIALQASLADVRLGAEDERTASYALVLPITVEKVP